MVYRRGSHGTARTAPPPLAKAPPPSPTGPHAHAHVRVRTCTHARTKTHGHTNKIGRGTHRCTSTVYAAVPATTSPPRVSASSCASWAGPVMRDGAWTKLGGLRGHGRAVRGSGRCHQRDEAKRQSCGGHRRVSPGTVALWSFVGFARYIMVLGPVGYVRVRPGTSGYVRVL
jgi:hypothetical protein